MAIGNYKILAPAEVIDPAFRFTAIPGDDSVFSIAGPIETDEFTINCEQDATNNGDIYIQFETSFRGLTLLPGENVKFSQPVKLGQNAKGLIQLKNLVDLKLEFFLVE